MLNLIQQLILNNSIILVGIVAILVLASSGIITVYYTTQEEEQNKNISYTNTVFAIVAISIILLISFLAFWVIFCPNIDPSPDSPVNGTIRMKAIAIFLMAVIGLIPSVNILVKRFLKPEEKHKNTTTTEGILVIGSSVISMLIVLYMFIKFYLYVDPTALSMTSSSSSGYGYGGY